MAEVGKRLRSLPAFVLGLGSHNARSKEETASFPHTRHRREPGRSNVGIIARLDMRKLAIG
jgi:hypothetical protein